MATVDQRIYQMLLQQDQKQQDPNSEQQTQKQYGPSFLVHVIFKAVPIALVILQGILTPLLSKLIILQIIIVVVVLDFWLTKNVNGKKMIGVRWGFQENQFGDQKFQFEGRVNEQFVSPLSSKLFWLVLVLYVAAAAVLVVFGFLGNTASIFKNIDDFLIRIGIFLGGAINLYFFWKAKSGLGTRRGQIQSKLGNEFVNKLGLATIVSYL